MVKKKRNIKLKIKKINVALIILSIIFIILAVCLVILGKNTFKKKSNAAEAEIVDKIEKYDYYITDRSTEYFKKLYEELKKILNEEKLDEEKYVSKLGQLFAADFYDLDSKISKSDVGGVQFIYDSFQDIFVKKASDSNGMYYYVKSNIYGDRKQTLPKVKDVSVESVKKISFINEPYKDENAYEVKVKITYTSDLGYPSNVTLVFAHNDTKLEIVEVK